jgi:hypothetical protein
VVHTLAALKRELERQQSTQIPGQSTGPYVVLGPSGRMGLAPPPSLDSTGNHVTRIRQLLPLVRNAADDLAVRLGPNGNTFPELVRDLDHYRAAIGISETEIDWAVVWGYGVRLETSASATERNIDLRLEPALEDAALAALQSLRRLHGPLILATADGRELQEQADRLLMTRGQYEALRNDASIIADALKADTDVIEPSAAAMVGRAAEAIGEAPHPERGTVFGIVAIKNVASVMISAATLAALVPAGLAAGGPLTAAGAADVAWIGYEGIQEE